MITPLEGDLKRFHEIVKGKVRENLREYLVNDKLISQQGKRGIVVPIPHIQLPYFRYGDPRKGVGQGKGDIGDVLGPGDFREGDIGAGTEPGKHYIEAEVSIEELAEILGEVLELPRIQPKKHQHIEGTIDRYTSVRRVGPESLRFMRRTMREVLKRAIASGVYDPDDPFLVPIKDDKRYRSWKPYPSPDNNAVVFMMRDFSGSIDEHKKRLIRITCFWLDIWLRKHYKNIVMVYIGHDMQAAILEAEEFFTLTSGGGTLISSAYELCSKLIKNKFSPESWNLYGFHFTDGENWDYDNDRALQALKQDLVPMMNLFGYCEVVNQWAWDYCFASRIDSAYEHNLPGNMVIARVGKEADILDGLKKFLGKGK